MNRIERLAAILLLLQEEPHTSQEIARHFEVSKRTVLRDVQALSEMGVPVIAREGPGGGYSLPASYLPAPLPLTAPETFLLLFALGALERLADLPFARERATLALKLRALLPEGRLDAVEGLLARVEVDVPQRAERAPFLDDLVRAAEQETWVRIRYRSVERESLQHILPAQITMQNGLWYCRAYSDEHGQERTYRVDRILDLLAPAAGFHPRVRPPLRAYQDPAHPQILARLTPRGVAAVEREPHLGPQVRRLPDGRGELCFRCPPGELDWFSGYFAGLGTEVEVLAPAELRRRLHAWGEKLVGLYEKTVT